MDQDMVVRRAGRQDVAGIAALLKEAVPRQGPAAENDVLEWLFSKGLVVATEADVLLGVAAWQAENLVAVTDVLALAPHSVAPAGAALLDFIEAGAGSLMCEVNIVLLPAEGGSQVRALLQQQGYERQEFESLHRIWREVLGEFEVKDREFLVKGLRERMIMVPL